MEMPMTKRMRAILRGAGSIMDISPAPNLYEQWIPRGTSEERLNAVWARVGQHIRNAAGEVHGESAARTKQAT